MGQLTRPKVARLLERHKDFLPSVYIETGLREGRSLVAAAARFAVVHGIELDAHWVDVCRGKTHAMPHVTVHHGDTRDVLPLLLKQYATTPLFLFLDAHYCETDPPIARSPFPLWAELEVLRSRPTRDIVVIDDVHTFGKARPELRFNPETPEWEHVTQASLTSFFGPLVRDTAIDSDSFVIWKDAA